LAETLHPLGKEVEFCPADRNQGPKYAPIWREVSIEPKKRAERHDRKNELAALETTGRARLFRAGVWISLGREQNARAQGPARGGRLMHALPSYLHFPREVWISAGVGFVVALAVMWLLVWAGRRRYVIIGNSPAVDVLAYHLGRIADTLDRLPLPGPSLGRESQQVRESARREVEPPRVSPVPSAEPEHPVPAHRIGMSIFGR
jgi:hypothetical protein